MNPFDQLLKKNRACIRGHWAYFNDSSELPRQGFKIHISAHPKNYLRVLKAVLPFLIEKNISFKCVRSLETLIQLNTGILGVSQIGKYITVYACDDFQSLLQSLETLCRQFKGPIISSDIRYKETNLYYRYGVINCTDGKDKFLLTPQGYYIPDQRTKKHALPPWINFENLTSKSTHLLKNIILTQSLRLRGRGGVYKGILKRQRDIKKVVIKEARPFGEYMSRRDNAQLRLLNEKTILEYIAKTNIAPQVYAFRRDANHFMLIIQQLEGKTLKEILYTYKKFSQEFIESFIILILRALNKIHSQEIYHGDLNPDNIIINNELQLIDFEHAVKWQGDLVTLPYGSRGFYPSDQDECLLNKKELKRRDFFAVEKCIWALNYPLKYRELTHA